MGYKIWKREHFKRLKVKRWRRSKLQYLTGRCDYWEEIDEPDHSWRNLRRKVQLIEKWEAEDYNRHHEAMAMKRRMNESIHGGLCNFSSRYFHILWRRAENEICRLHLQGLHEEADDLDPQPERLGIMRY
jgi:hypothetical protein